MLKEKIRGTGAHGLSTHFVQSNNFMNKMYSIIKNMFVNVTRKVFMIMQLKIH